MCARGTTEPGGGAQPVTRKAGGASAKIPWVSGLYEQGEREEMLREGLCPPPSWA